MGAICKKQQQKHVLLDDGLHNNKHCKINFVFVKKNKRDAQ
jgi:hypothetical protein